MKNIATIMAFAAILSASSNAEVSYDILSESETGLFASRVLNINGFITDEDADVVMRMRETLSRYQPDTVVRLNATGSNHEPAMVIGMVLRSALASVEVLHDSNCSGSCVLALDGGADRKIYGHVGVNMPTPEELLVAESRWNETTIENDIKTYFEIMDVSMSLDDAMLHVPSSRVQYLSQRDLYETGLTNEDPYGREALKNRVAASLGLTDREWTRVKSSCKPGAPGYTDCFKSITGKAK